MGSVGSTCEESRPRKKIKKRVLVAADMGKVMKIGNGVFLTLFVATAGFAFTIAYPTQGNGKEDSANTEARGLSSLGGGNILRAVDARQLSQLGGGNILRDLSALGGGNILRSLPRPQASPLYYHLPVRATGTKRAASFDLIDSHDGFGRFVKRGMSPDTMFDQIDSGAGFGRFVKRDAAFDMIDHDGFGRFV